MSNERDAALADMASTLRFVSARRKKITEAAPDAVAVILATLTKGLSYDQNQCVARFVAWLYNWSTFKFKIDDLRELDPEILDACLAFMTYCFTTNECVHHTLPGGRRQLMDFLVKYKVCGKKFADDACRGDLNVA